jgi:hypothetical protein
MPRPPKYATALEAAHNNLYSKMGGLSMGLSIEQFMHIATGKCELCGQPPKELLLIDRQHDCYELMWHYVFPTENGHVPMCKMCKTLAQQFPIKELISHCARIMARRMWQVHSKWLDMFLQGQDKPLVERSGNPAPTGIGKE